MMLESPKGPIFVGEVISIPSVTDHKLFQVVTMIHEECGMKAASA